MSPTRTTFLGAARLVADLVATPEVAAAWEVASVLPGFTVGGVAGHAYLAARIVERRLDEPVPAGERRRGLGEYFGGVHVDKPAQLDEPAHRTIRSDGEHVAREGADAVAQRFTRLLDRLTRRLDDEPPDRLMVTSIPEAPARLDDFLVNRTIEMGRARGRPGAQRRPAGCRPGARHRRARDRRPGRHRPPPRRRPHSAPGSGRT